MPIVEKRLKSNRSKIQDSGAHIIGPRWADGDPMFRGLEPHMMVCGNCGSTDTGPAWRLRDNNDNGGGWQTVIHCHRCNEFWTP